MLLCELVDLVEMDRFDLQQVTQQVIKLYGLSRIFVFFTPHFKDRCLDGNVDRQGNNRGAQINPVEFRDVFAKILDRYEDYIKQHIGQEVIFHDNATNLNIAGTIRYNDERKNTVLIVDTIMKTNLFHPSKTRNPIKLEV